MAQVTPTDGRPATSKEVGRRARVAPRVASLPPSGIREFFDLVQTMDDVISLGVGEPDFRTPWHVCDEIIDSLERGRTAYTSNQGIIELRTAISGYLQRLYGVEYDPNSEVLVTNGVSEGIDIAMRATLCPGDSVLVPEPCFVSYSACAWLAGGEAIPVPTRIENGFRLRREDLEAAVRPNTRSLMLGYPSNPTGAVMTRAEMGEVAQFVLDHDLLVYSDEIYDRLIYDGHQHVCFATLPGMRERTILLNGFSKAFAMTGLRVGYTCAPADLTEAMCRIHQYAAMCCSTSSQIGAAEALAHGEGEVQRMVADYDQRRRLLVGALKDMGLDCFEPQGAFYTFPSIRSTGLTSREFASRLLEEERVAVVPGTAFGPCGEGHVRACYATSRENLRLAVDRIRRFIDRLH